MSTYIGPDYFIPVAWTCATAGIASGVYCIVTSRRNPNNLSHALQLHGFIIFVITAIGFILHFMGTYVIHYSDSIFKKRGEVSITDMEYSAQFAEYYSTIAKHGLWFSSIVALSAFLGVIALIIKKPNKTRHDNPY